MAGRGDAWLIVELVKLPYYLGKLGYRGLGGRRPNTVKIPCWGPKGAVQDYDYIVLQYEKFGGRSCYAFLPDAIRLMHEQHAAVVRATASYQRYMAGWDPTYYVTRPSDVWLPCSDPLNAFKDYNQVILGYQEYSGPRCWQQLPPDIAVLHAAYVQRVVAWLRAQELQTAAALHILPHQPPPQYPLPQYAAPQYAAPQYAAPQYAAPQYAAPQYAAPQYG